MKFSFRYQLVFPCLLILFPLVFVIHAGQSSIDTNQKKLFLAEADSLIRIENYEEALISYFMAYELGLPRDSLFYLWAELYIKKGDLDSALAVNQSAMEMCSAALRNDLLKQRYSIYVFLGADEAALKISRELAETGHKIKPGITPYLNTGIYLKAEQEKLSLSDSSYWTHSGSAEDPVNRVFGTYQLSGNLKFTDLPGRFPDFSLGTVFQIRRNTELSIKSASTAFDSLSIESGGYFRLENLAQRLGVELRSVYNFDSYKTKRWTHGLVYSFMVSEKIFSVGAYNVALKEGKHYDYQQGFISLILDMVNRAAVTFTPSLNLSCFFTRDQPMVDASVYSSLVYVDYSAVQSDKLPLFYKDKEKKNPLDTNGLNNGGFFSRVYYNDRIKNGSTAITFEQPLSRFRIEPAVSSAILLKRKWTVKPGIRCGLDIYNGLYRWNDFDKTIITSYLAMDPEDNSYYQITGINNMVHDTIKIGEKVGSSHSQRRIDTDLQGSVSVGHTFKRAGNIIFSLQLNKSWTNLPSYCPVEISDWSVAFITDWQCSIKFRKKR